MFCRFCGNNATSDSVFCPKCGKKIGEDLISSKAFNMVNSKSIIHEHKVFILVYIIIFIFGVLIYSYKLEEDWKHSYYDNVAFEKTFFIIAFFILPLLFYFVLQVFKVKVYLGNLRVQLLRLAAFVIDLVILIPFFAFIVNPEVVGFKYPEIELLQSYYDSKEFHYIIINFVVLGIIYFGLTHFILNGKIGYKILKLKVANFNNNNGVSIRSKFIRIFLMILEICSLGLLTFASFFNKNGRTLCDIFSGTQVRW
ncbi:MAG: RDD family protein [bacterium]|nr:RDD family protein [bacterium]